MNDQQVIKLKAGGLSGKRCQSSQGVWLVQSCTVAVVRRGKVRYQLSGTEAGMPDPWRVLVTQSDFYSPHLGGQVQHNTYTSLYEQRTIELNFLNQSRKQYACRRQGYVCVSHNNCRGGLMYYENVPT